MKFFIAFLSFILLANPIWAIGTKEPIVKFNETYELANIILALTEYGKTDKNEINKNSAYYNEILSYFDQYSNHPLIKKVNYSRQMWDKLLSFRTDAVAFEFEQNNTIHRKYKFYAMGKKINEFENNLKLIEDFAAITNFRKFFADKKIYFEHLQNLYENSLYINQVEEFLTKEFMMTVESKHQIIVSPLVGRMHCQRFFNNASTSFINIPDYIISASDLNGINKEKVAAGIHMFFTEIDHDYVNPTTNKYKALVKKNFKQKLWDKDSGYGNIKQGIFNEYMTWAVYDIFILQSFPNEAEKIIKDWHKVNSGRGFFASNLFGQKLVELYNKKEHHETIKDLYPKLLAWCSESCLHLEQLLKNNSN